MNPRLWLWHAVLRATSRGVRTRLLLWQTLQSLSYLPFATAVTWLIDDVLQHPERWPNIPRVLLVFALVNLGAWLLHAAITVAGFAAAQRLTRGTVAELRKLCLQQLERLSLSYFQRRGAAAIANQLTVDLARVETFLGQVANGFVPGLVLGVAAFAYLVWKNTTLASLTLCVIPVQYLVIRVGQKRVEGLQKAVQGESEDFARDLSEFLLGMRVLRSFAATSWAGERMAASVDRLRDVGFAASVTTMRYSFIIQIAYQYLPTVVWCVGGLLMLRGRVTVGELVAFVALLAYVQHGLTTLTSAYEQWLGARPGLSEMMRLLASSDIEVDDEVAVEESGSIGAIHFADVSFGHPGRALLFQKLNLTLHAHECVALVGASGAGKSTLLDLLMRFVEPTSGSIVFENTRATPPRAWIRAKVAVMGQESYLFRASLADNIRLARPGATLEDVERAADLAGAGTFIRALPKGFMTEVGAQGTLLSGGERQRIALARIFLRNPDVVILDEPTSALDETTEQAILPNLMRLMENRTAIVVTHRAALLACATRVLHMQNGTIVRDERTGNTNAL